MGRNFIFLAHISFILKISLFTPPSLLHQGPQHILEWENRFRVSKEVKDTETKPADMGEGCRATGRACEEMSHMTQRQRVKKAF